MGFLKIQFVAKYQKMKGALFRHQEIFEKVLQSRKRGKGMSHGAEKKRKGVTFLLCNGCAFHVRGLDAFKIKYQILLVKVQGAKNVVHTG